MRVRVSTRTSCPVFSCQTYMGGSSLSCTNSPGFLWLLVLFGSVASEWLRDLSALLLYYLRRYPSCLGCNLCDLFAVPTWYQGAKARENIGGTREFPFTTLLGWIWTCHVCFIRFVELFQWLSSSNIFRLRSIYPGDRKSVV